MKKHLGLALAVSLVPMLVSAGEPSASDTQQPTPAAVTPTPVPKPYEDIIKLWKANLSEDFIRRQIETGGVVYYMGAEDIVRCKEAGLPESLIQSLILTAKPGVPGTVGTTPVKVVPGSTAPMPVTAQPLATPQPGAPPPPRKFEGLARRNSGVVLFKSRWDVGNLEFKEGNIQWSDAKDQGKNLFVTTKQITEHYLTCLKKPGGNECFEWGFKTKDGDYKFRDVSWEQGENKKALELYEYLKTTFPTIIASEIPVDSK